MTASPGPGPEAAPPGPASPGRPAWVEVDRGAIRRNVERIRRRLPAGTHYLAVVKANGYGHGGISAARAAIAGGATWLGVVLVDEAIRLRDAGIEAPILLLHEPPPRRAAEVLASGLTPCAFTRLGVEALGDAAERADRTLRIHLKVDTGLNRMGAPPDLLDEVVAALAKERRLEVEGLFSHFAFADDPGNPFIDEQAARFEEMCARLARHGIDPPIRHLANSAAALTRDDVFYEMVRIGIATYGIAPGLRLRAQVAAEGFEPALSLRARAAMVKRVRAGEGVSYGLRYRPGRDATIVTLPLGYADGWPRRLSGRASVLIRGERHPAVGAVTMDSFAVDIGDGECDVGEEVVLIGAQGRERITADEVAEEAGTIAYETVASLSSRLPRITVET